MPLNPQLVDRERQITVAGTDSEPLERVLAVVDLQGYSLNWIPTGSLAGDHFVAETAP